MVVDVHSNTEDFTQDRRRQDLGGGAIAKDPAVFEGNDASYLRDDVGQVVRHQDDVGALLGQAAQACREVAACAQVEAVGGLVEHQGPRLVGQGPGDEQAARFS